MGATCGGVQALNICECECLSECLSGVLDGTAKEVPAVATDSTKVKLPVLLGRTHQESVHIMRHNYTGP